MLIELIEKAENVGWGTIAVVIAGVFMLVLFALIIRWFFGAVFGLFR